MNHKIVFFRYLPLTKKLVEDFYMFEMVSWGYDVEFWDITSLFFPDQQVESYVPNKKIRLISIKTKKDFNSRVRTCKDALFISLMTFAPNLIWIFRAFKCNHCKTAVFSYLPMPLNTISSCSHLKNVGIKYICNRLYTRVSVFCAIKMGYISSYDYVFKGGEYGWIGIGNMRREYLVKTKFYEVNNWDYDKFVKSNISIKKDPFIVFLDEYYPFHPDALLFGRSTVDPTTYFDDLNRVFSSIEKYYGMPVVIAAHPKALKYKEKNYFNGREVLFNQSLDLVSRCSLVLAHDSLSIGFAIMCKKPLVFINSSEISSKLVHNSCSIDAYSKFFHSPLLWADNPVLDDLPKVFELSNETESVYDGMIKNYMSTIDKQIPNVVLLRSYLEEIFMDKGVISYARGIHQ